MFLDWWHKLRNPHCQHCIDERREAKICASCEVLQLQVAKLQYENERLLNRLLDKPVEEVKTDTTEFKPVMPKLPWRARQAMLEREDRHTAKLNKMKSEAIGKITTEDLESEMGIVEQEREAQKG